MSPSVNRIKAGGQPIAGAGSTMQHTVQGVHCVRDTVPQNSPAA